MQHPTVDAIAGVVIAFIRDNFLFDDSPVARDVSLTESGIMDSTGVLEMLLFLEETFGITVADEEVVPEHFDSVARISTYVRRKLEA
jgi:acyl carrier protein